MEGPAREGVSVADLAYVLKTIRGGREPELEIECEPNEEKTGLARMIVFDQDGNLQFRTGGQQKVANKFRSFYINKLQAEATSNYPRVAKPAEVKAEQEIRRKPPLSAKTLQYAEKRKMKLGSQGSDIVEHLQRKHTIMDEKKKAKAD